MGDGLYNSLEESKYGLENLFESFLEQAVWCCWRCGRGSLGILSVRMARPEGLTPFGADMWVAGQPQISESKKVFGTSIGVSGVKSVYQVGAEL